MQSFVTITQLFKGCIEKITMFLFLKEIRAGPNDCKQQAFYFYECLLLIYIYITFLV